MFLTSGCWAIIPYIPLSRTGSRALLRPADLFLGLFIVLCAATLLIYFNTGAQNETVAVITVDSQEIARIPLEDEKSAEIPIQGEYPLVVVVTGRRVCVQQAECPDKLCENTGWISRTGSGIICLPARVSVRIEGAQMPDGITY